MKFSVSTIAVLALATQSVTADWLGRAAYNKWHETELERWLSDHDIPYPAAADRKDLQNLVKDNWNDYVAKPYSKWDASQLSSYLSSKGKQVEKEAEKNKDSLLTQVEGLWHETSDQASDAYSSVQDWIFDSWTESQLKSFLDYHNIPNPSPNTRDSLLSTARGNYAKVAEKAGETAAYPGDWLWSQWSDSDLKSWLDTNGIPAPQANSRDKLIASIRRNSKLASNKASQEYSKASAEASKSAAAAQETLSDQLLDSWSDSQIKAWCDKNGIKIPQGSKRNELVALVRKNTAKLTGDNASASGASAYGAATSHAGNYYAEATAHAYSLAHYYYDLGLNYLGVASKEAQASLSSASSVASVEASKSSSVASKSATSGASAASASVASAKNEL